MNVHENSRTQVVPTCPCGPLPFVEEIARGMGFDTSGALEYRVAVMEAMIQQRFADLASIDARLAALANQENRVGSANSALAQDMVQVVPERPAKRQRLI